MIFNHNGVLYRINFQYQLPLVRNPHWIGVKDAVFTEEQPEWINGRWPNTIGSLDIMTRDADGRLQVAQTDFRRHTIGCWHHEKVFNPEVGRIRALRAITPTLTREMRKSMWTAYTDRYAIAAAERVAAELKKEQQDAAA